MPQRLKSDTASKKSPEQEQPKVILKELPFCPGDKRKFIFMETLAEQPTQEQLRSFDPLASVKMLRFDLDRFGRVLTETRLRVCDEELSYLVEGVDRAARTTFVLKREGDDLVYFDDSQWRPYTGMLITGLKTAEQEARNDPRREFLADWARRDLDYGYKMRGLQPGQQLVWHSSYPHEVAALHGEKFLRQCGLQPDRKMGFVYRASGRPDGSVILESQTVDQSAAEAFAAVEHLSEYDPNADMETLTRSYDGELVKKYGGHFYAGRREAAVQENAWNTIREHRDLIQYFLDGLESIAARQTSTIEDLEVAAKRHVYGSWAAFKKRLDGNQFRANFSAGNGGAVRFVQLEMEVRGAFREFASKGRVMVGCGGSISVEQGESDIMNASGESVFSSIFGNKSSESYKFDKKMYCVVCQAPPKEKNEPKKLCGPCGICAACDKRMQKKG